MSWWAWLVVAAVVAVLVAATLLCVARARRLDRLHVRIDAARAGLRSALDRRAEMALLVAASAPRSPPEQVARLRAAARAALAAGGDRETREAVENELTRRLAAVERGALDADLLPELVDAEQLVVLARRVHNDAVRDTLGLRSRRLVRWLRLAGTAPVPVYFEIADPEPGVAHQSPVAPPS